MTALSLDQALDQWAGDLTRGGKRPASVDTYTRTISRWAAHLHPTPWTDATADQLAAYLTRPIADSTRAFERHVIGRFYEWAALVGHIPADPMTDAAQQPWPARQPWPLTTTQARRVLAQATSPQDRCIFWLTLGAGMRPAAVASLRVGDVDRLTLPPAGRTACQEQAAGRDPRQPLVPGPTTPDRPLHHITVGRRLNRLFRAAGVPGSGQRLRDTRDVILASPNPAKTFREVDR